MQAIPGLVILLWIQLYVALVPTWRDGEYYNYGWFVPALAAGLAWRRWKHHAPSFTSFSATSRVTTVWVLMSVVAVILLAPLRLINHADPGWRPPLLLHAGIVVLLTHFLLARAFNRRFSLVFLPVTLVALTAVPWPWQIEQHIIRSLTGLVVTITREWFLLGGNPVELIGERLALGSEVVEVTDGCSGIRSIQSLVMVALFFGELFLLSTPRRFVLVTLSGLAAVMFNTLRACWLASIQFADGREAAAAAHDRIGHTTFILSAATLWLAAYALLQTTHRPQTTLRRTIHRPEIREQGSEI